ncbi:MAG: hypothetical protein RL240_320 [Planctomycetota bacterium]
MAVPTFTEWPTPKAAILSALVDALRRRSKALNKRVQKFDIELTHESVDGNVFERLNLNLENWMPNRDRLSFVIWDDGTLWVDARRSSKNGWDYEFAVYASCSEIEPAEITETIERSLWITDLDKMLTVWSRFEPYRK